MSGHIRQYSPQSQAWVPRGADGKFAPKVLSQQQAGQQQQVRVLVQPPRSPEPPLVYRPKR